MKHDEKGDLQDALDAAHASIQRILEGVDLERLVYTDSDWRIRDVIGHIATWDIEVTRSIRAFLAEGEYITPGFVEGEDEFNQQAVNEQRTLSTEQLVAEWEQAREDFKAAINEIPGDQFPGDMLYPWGDERGSISLLVDYMVDHDEEHRDEIVAALQSS